MFRRKRKESDFSVEIAEHIRLESERLREQGLSEEEARAAARRAFGNVMHAEERFYEAHRWLWWDHLRQDLRFGLRMLRKSPGFTLVVILTLALGIGANTAIFSLIDAVMLRMLSVDRPEELFQVKILNPSRPGIANGGFTNPLWEQVLGQQDVFSDAFAWGPTGFDLGQGGAVKLAHGLWVSGGFFQGLRLRPAAGRLIDASDDRRGCPAVTVLSYGFWQGHFAGEESAIGSTLSLGKQPFQVIGVAPSGFYGMELGDKFDVAVPICAVDIFERKESRLDQRSYWWLQVGGRSRAGSDRDRVGARLKALSPGIFGAALPQDWSKEGQENFLKRTLTMVPAGTGISDFGVRAHFERPLYILMGVVGVVMLIACANIASLMLARGAARHQEIAVRQALGAKRVRLISQLLTECILLSTCGALLGVLFARWGTALLVHYMSRSANTIFLNLSPDSRVLGFTAGVAILTAVLFGLLPAWRSTRVTLSSAMKGSAALETEGRMRFQTSKWIVGCQIALSLVLLVAAGLFLRSFAKLATLDIGFDRNNVLLVGANLKAANVPDEQLQATYENIDERLRALPSVVSVGRSMISPLEGGAWSQPIKTDWSQRLGEDEAETWMNSISPGYFETLRTPMLGGRNFTKADSDTAPRVAIINQTLARRFFPGLNPIGRTFRIERTSGEFGAPMEVVGLVKDSKYESVREDTHPTAFFPDAQPRAARFLEAENFELRTQIRPSALVSAVQDAIGRVNKSIPLQFNTLADQVNDSMIQERLLAMLSGFFGALALLLAVIGLYGTLSYVVSRRQAEFGIRLALGALPGSIVRLVMSSVISVLVGGVVVGLGISLATARTLASLLFDLGPHDRVTIIVAASVLSLVALAAGYFPARRAGKVDPMVALRYE